MLDEVQGEVTEYCRQDQEKDDYYETTYRKQERFYWGPVLKWIDSLPGVNSVVDIGAAYGSLLLYTYKIHKPDKIVAIDPQDYMPSDLIDEYSIRMVKADIERENVLKGEKFDLVIFTEVLEHLNFHPLTTLRKLAALLSEKGSLILTTPDVKEWGVRKQYYSGLEDIPVYQGQEDEPIRDHIWHYSLEEAQRVCREAGLEISEWNYSRGVKARHICLLLRVKGADD